MVNEVVRNALITVVLLTLVFSPGSLRAQVKGRWTKVDAGNRREE